MACQQPRVTSADLCYTTMKDANKDPLEQETKKLIPKYELSDQSKRSAKECEGFVIIVTCRVAGQICSFTRAHATITETNY